MFHRLGARSNYVDNVDGDLLVDTESSPRRADFGALRYDVRSRLLVLIETPEQRQQNRGISYFVRENDRLRRIRIVRKPSK